MPAMLSDEDRLYILSSALDDKELELIIFPTEQCNFRCTYCYEDFAQGRLSPEHVAALKVLIETRCRDGLRHLRLSWFGGEPLVAYDIVRDISSHAHRCCLDHGTTLNVNLTTNGWLLDEQRFLELASCGACEYQISLDGDQEEHDRTRVRKGGRPSFKRIYDVLTTYNRMRLQGLLPDTNVILRLHLHPANTGSMLALARRIERDFDPRFFSIYLKEVGYYGGQHDGSYAVFNETDRALSEVKTRLREILHAFIDESSINRIDVCYAGKANSFTIRANGSVGKCTLALDSDFNQVGTLTAGGTLALDGPALGRWVQVLAEMREEDLVCPAHRVSQLARETARIAA